MARGKHKSMAERRSELESVEAENQRLKFASQKFESKLAELRSEIHELKEMHADRVRKLNEQLAESVSDDLIEAQKAAVDLLAVLDEERNAHKAQSEEYSRLKTAVVTHFRQSGMSEASAFDVLLDWLGWGSRVIARDISKAGARKLKPETAERLIRAKGDQMSSGMVAR